MCGNVYLRFNEICSVQFKCYTLEKVYLHERARKLPDDIIQNSSIFWRYIYKYPRRWTWHNKKKKATVYTLYFSQIITRYYKALVYQERYKP